MMRRSTLRQCKSAHGAELAFLDEPEQLDLHFEREIADFVEEGGTAVASSTSPFLFSTAPLKAPFTWPNNSLSMSVPTSEPQSMGTNSPCGLALCTARATTSLPVPLSPSSSTESRLRETLVMSRRRALICGDWPTRP